MITDRIGPRTVLLPYYLSKSKHLFAFLIISTVAAARASHVFLCSHREVQLVKHLLSYKMAGI